MRGLFEVSHWKRRFRAPHRVWLVAAVALLAALALVLVNSRTLADPGRGETEMLYRQAGANAAKRLASIPAGVLSIFSVLLLILLCRVRTAKRAAILASSAKSQFLANEAMKGKIWVESEPGKGSSFHFTACFDVVEKNASPETEVSTVVSDPPADSPFRSGFRVLLAEDNIVNQRVALRMLERRGHRVVVACNGREALSALNEQRFDVVLMDVQMPEVDGLEATAAIRARERGTNLHTPVIAMTAHALSGDQERCLAAGMDDYIAKPIRSRKLLHLVEKYGSVVI